MASHNRGVGGHQGGADEVKAAFTPGFPVERADIVAGIQAEGARSEGKTEGGDGIGIVGVVVGNVERAAAAIVGSVAHHPVVHLAAVDEVPTIDTGILKVAAVGHSGRGNDKGGEGGVTVVDIAVAVGIDIDVIGSGRIKTRDDREGVGDMDGSHVAGARNEGHTVVLHIPSGVVAGVGPSDGGAVQQDVGGGKLLNTCTCGDDVKADVVNVCIPCAGRTEGADGHEAAGAGVAVEGNDKLGPLGVTTDVDGLNGHEGSVAVAIHNTHLEDGVIAGAAASGPEGELQGIDGQCGDIYLREDDIHIVTIGASGGGTIPVEASAAAEGVVVGGVVGHIRIST